MINYVGVLCFSHDFTKLVVLKKQHGPSMLIGKLNFPGGKVESGEMLAAAASREYLEETGVVIPVGSLIKLGEIGVPQQYQLTVFYTTSAHVEQARTTTDEEVSVIELDELFKLEKSAPERLSPDLSTWLRYALEHAAQYHFKTIS